MSKQTAVEWLEKCFASHWNYEEHAKWDGLIQHAKQMEKEQTTKAYIAGSHHLPIPPKTYGGDHE
jgi:phenylalanine-4-hydroxylase